MKERPTSCARKVRAALGIILVVGPLWWLAVLEVDAQCPLPPTTHPNSVIEGPVSCIADESRDSAVAMDDQDKFIVPFEQPRVSPSIGRDVFVQRFTSNGLTLGNVAPLSVTNGNEDQHFQTSVAMSRDGLVRVGWMGIRPSPIQITPPTVLVSDFDFDLLDIIPTPSPFPGVDEWDPSVGVSSAATGIRSVTWTRSSPTVLPTGLLYQVATPPVVQIRDCEPNAPCPTCGDICWINKWEPALSQRSDGVFAIAWAEAENPASPISPFNILLQLYQADGTTFGGEVLVNIPGNEAFLSTQESPEIAFDDTGNIIVVWTGPVLDGCTPPSRHIFARRLFWNGAGTPTFVSVPFQVDNDPTASPISGADANPTVALTLDPAEPGRFIIAWNASLDAIHEEIRAQFFEANGLPKGTQFRLNQDTSETGGGATRRKLANSGQHTLAYGVDRVVATWTTFDNLGDPGEVHFTLLPPLFSDSLGEACCKADVNGDGLRDGLDIQPFVDLLLNPPPADPCQSIVEQYLLICPADMDSDGDVDVDDVPLFVTALLDTIPCAMGGFNPGASTDCNSNGRPDATDVFFGTSQDCNLNGVPDECDISSQSSGDVNGNGVPDECEPDCNNNGVPDDKDITAGTSGDVNSNGVPDECDPDCNANGVPDDWDLSQGTSADCNSDGVPDDCEEDCNGNGVPDDCDIDPTDPDGDGLVSADCNGNNWPDECDLAVPPPFGSLDCNNNGLPDECDIADCQGDPACGDCNGNGVPDACDISSGISADADGNGIPDECEGQQAQGGGSGGVPTLETYTAFYDWCFAQQWGPHAGCTCSEQFQGMVNMEQALGLPLGDPKYMPAPQE